MSDVVLCECFARDGLQHESEFVPTATKRALKLADDYEHLARQAEEREMAAIVNHISGPA